MHLSLRALLGASAALILCLGTAACGDGGGSATSPTATTATEPQATAPSATEPPPDATTPPGGAEHSGREQEMQDSEPVQIDATFTLRGGRLTPRTVTTPAFLAVTLSVRNGDGVPRTVLVKVGRGYRLALGPGQRRQRQIPGQQAGTYPVLVDGKRRGALVFGGEPGP